MQIIPAPIEICWQTKEKNAYSGCLPYKYSTLTPKDGRGLILDGINSDNLKPEMR